MTEVSEQLSIRCVCLCWWRTAKVICYPKRQGNNLRVFPKHQPQQTGIEPMLHSGITCEGLSFLRNDGWREAANARWIWVCGTGDGRGWVR